MNKLQIKRKESGLSQSELAKRADMSIRTLQALESGARDIRNMALSKAINLAAALGCRVEELI